MLEFFPVFFCYGCQRRIPFHYHGTRDALRFLPTHQIRNIPDAFAFRGDNPLLSSYHGCTPEIISHGDTIWFFVSQCQRYLSAEVIVIFLSFIFYLFATMRTYLRNIFSVCISSTNPGTKYTCWKSEYSDPKKRNDSPKNFLRCDRIYIAIFNSG